MSLHLVTPESDLKAGEEVTVSSDLMVRFGLSKWETAHKRASTCPRTFEHLLSPYLKALARDKPRVLQVEKANLAGVVREETSSSTIQEIPLDLMRRSFMLRKKDKPPESAVRVSAKASASSVPQDLAPTLQTTNRIYNAPKKAKRSRSPPTAADDAKEKLREALAPVVTKLLRQTWGQKWKNPFKVVITRENCASQGVPNYFEFVETPMNLTWVKEKLHRKEYASVADFQADVMLIVSNAQKFNKPQDPVYGYADTLKEVFEREMNFLPADVKDEAAAAAAAAGAAGGPDDAPKAKKTRPAGGT